MAGEQNQRREAALNDDPMRNVLDTEAMDGGAMQPAGVAPGFEMVAARQGQHTGGDIITAQRVAVPRNRSRIVLALKALAAAAGTNYVYGWKVKDRRNQRETWIEGPTIKLANDLVREYGNCMVNVRVVDAGQSWMMYGRFVDLESGFTTERAYQQRKGQDVGMGDAQRASDMIFQIGQSKCIRNVVVNALQTYADMMVEEAKGALLTKVGNEPDKARAWLVKKMAEKNVDQKRVEAIYGRTAEHWTVPDMVKIYTEMQSIIDGMMTADEVYPLPQQDQQVAETDTKKDPLVKGASGRPKKGTDNAPPPGQAGSSQAGEAKGIRPDAPLATGGAVGGAPNVDGEPNSANGGCPVIYNGLAIGHVSDTNLKEGDPLVMGKVEYVVEHVKPRDDAGPVYTVKPAAEDQVKSKTEAPAQQPRRSMFRKPAA